MTRRDLKLCRRLAPMIFAGLWIVTLAGSSGVDIFWWMRR